MPSCKTWRSFMIVFAISVAQGCGGESEDGSPTGPPPLPPLTNASSMSEFASKFSTNYPGILVDFPKINEVAAAYDNSVSNVQGGLTVTGGNTNPFVGTWTLTAAHQHPVPSGRVRISGTGRVALNYQDINLTNDQAASMGSAQAFYGVAATGNATNLPFAAMAEVVVADSAGEPQYRALKYFYGSFQNRTGNDLIGNSTEWYLYPQSGQSVINSVPTYNGTPASLIETRYWLFVVECYVSACVTGKAIYFQGWLTRS